MITTGKDSDKYTRRRYKDITYFGNELKQPIVYGPTKEQVAQQESEKKAEKQVKREKLKAEIMKELEEKK